MLALDTKAGGWPERVVEFEYVLQIFSTPHTGLIRGGLNALFQGQDRTESRTIALYPPAAVREPAGALAEAIEAAAQLAFGLGSSL